jgi:hypothetical protein
MNSTKEAPQANCTVTVFDSQGQVTDTQALPFSVLGHAPAEVRTPLCATLFMPHIHSWAHQLLTRGFALACTVNAPVYEPDHRTSFGQTISFHILQVTTMRICDYGRTVCDSEVELDSPSRVIVGIRNTGRLPHLFMSTLGQCSHPTIAVPAHVITLRPNEARNLSFEVLCQSCRC